MSTLEVFSRERMLARIAQKDVWDIIVIGGGATGLGIALDAASRGYATLLVEQHDFAKGTSSRSTKLVHGGVRYLAQGNIRLIRDALRERGILLQNAPHIVRPLSFVIPCYHLFERIKYTAGLKFYDLLSGKRSFGRSVFLNKQKALQALPGINAKNLKGGVQYFDGQFDDARLAVSIAQTAATHGAVLLNYCRAIALHKDGEKISGIDVLDVLSGKKISLHARAVINATGVFVDEIMQMDDANKKPVVTTSQGTHIVVDRSFLPSSGALMIPKTSDGRVLFALPWHDHLLIGTTDNLRRPPDPLEPVAIQSEIQFLLDGIAGYLVKPPVHSDILTVFAGLRPLAASSAKNQSTKEISRDHKIITSGSGLVTITGGKWTTYRRMAMHAVTTAIEETKLPYKKSSTENIRLHGYAINATASHLSVYGSDEKNIRALMAQQPSLENILAAGHPYTEAEVIWAVRHEMAMTVEDVLARRMRLLFLDAKAAMIAAPKVAALMMKELHLTAEWKQQQIESFNNVALNYLIN